MGCTYVQVVEKSRRSTRVFTRITVAFTSLNLLEAASSAPFPHVQTPTMVEMVTTSW